MSATPRPTALVVHPACALHDTGWSHPEHQGRLPAVIQAVQSEMPDLLPILEQREAKIAGEGELLLAHTPEMIAIVREAAETAREGRPVLLDPDTIVSPASWDAALGAVGCAITAAAMVLEGEARTAFAACRPPGHHATHQRSMGFCLFNNVAVAARWLQRKGIGRILIVDWDVHHGNGTQDIFYEDPDVFYLSLHLEHHYPGTGRAEETGAGPGAGTTLNVPLRAGTPRGEYLDLARAALARAVEVCPPEFVFISAGFDCLQGDPLGGLLLEPADLHRLTREVLESTGATADGRVVVALEGGYAPKRLGRGVVEVLRALGELPPQH